MTLRTVRVPEKLAPIFEKAEAVVSEYFERHKADLARGTIEVSGDRHLLLRGASLSVEFFEVTRELFGEARREEADEFARNILFDLAHVMGKSDARNFHAEMGLEDLTERLSAGPAHFAHTGWASVEILEASRLEVGDDYFLLYDHPHSFESDAWIRAGKKSTFPVCVMGSGYSAGWCEESIGFKLVASELLCRARGDDCCRFVMAPPRQIEARLREYLERTPDIATRVGVYRVPDLFSRKRLDDELQEASGELERRVDERTEALRLANQSLEEEVRGRREAEARLVQGQKLEALGRLAGGLAHDFNNLLTVINGSTELMLGEMSEEEGLRSLAEEIGRAGVRASQLTKQLLVFSQQQVVKTEVVGLADLVLNMSEVLERLLGDQIDLLVEILDPNAHLSCNVSQLEQALLNLVANARDAMPMGGQLSLRIDSIVEEAGKSVRLRVSDSGTGMDKTTLGQLFDPFFSTKTSGRGLGLSSVYGIVQQAGGRVEVESDLGDGSCFTLLFPVVERPRAVELAKACCSGATSIGRRILLVEDDASVRDLVERSLVKNGHDVLTGENASEALAVFAAHTEEIDLLLTDVVMPPGASGVELAQQIRGLNEEIKIIFMSGYTDDQINKEGIEEAGAIFLQKPFRFIELERVICRLFHTSAAAP